MDECVYIGIESFSLGSPYIIGDIIYFKIAKNIKLIIDNNLMSKIITIYGFKLL